MKPSLSVRCSRRVLFAALMAGIVQPFAVRAGTAGEPDLSAAPVQALRAEYTGKREALAKQQAAELARIVADGLSLAQQMQSKAKVSGNVSAQAAASAAVRIYTDAGAALTQAGTFRFPDSVRQDLEAVVGASRKALQTSVDRHTSGLRALEAEYAPRLAKLLAVDSNAPDTEEEQLALLGKLAGAPAAGAAVETNTTPVAAVQLAASRDAKQWETVLRGDVTVAALEIVPVTVSGITAPRQNEGQGDESGQTYTVRLTPVRELVPADPPPAFRVMSLPPLSPVDVVGWPKAANGWSLELRIRPDKGGPSRHGFVLEVDAAAQAARLLPGQTPIPTAPAITPATPSPTAGVGTTPATAPAARTTGSAGVPASCRVASAGLEWVRTGVQVRKGERVVLTPTGTWSCGPGGERVDAAGYPNNDRFFRYYMDPQRNPRITPDADYGALIARVLPDGPILALPKQTPFTASKAGELALTINEDPAARRDNKGSLDVRISITP